MAMILIVEDDAFIRDMAEMLIQDSGHLTVTASDVDEALSILRSSQAIDALFTDIYLKTRVNGGCEVASQAVKLRPDLRVLYTTGNEITDAMRASFVVGAQCLSKPYSAQQLESSVSHLMRAS